MIAKLWLQELDQAAAGQAPPAFSLLPGFRGPSPSALLLSVALHIALAVVLPPLERWMPRPPPQFVAASQRDAESRLVIFYVPPNARVLREDVAPERRRPRGVAKPSPAPPPEPPVVAAPPRRTPANRLVLPPERAAVRQAILAFRAPEIRERRTLAQLPSIAVWTGSRIPPPEAVLPGTDKPVPSAPPPAVTPSLAVAVPGASPGDISIPNPKPARSRLTLPPASAVPVSAVEFEDPAVAAALPGETLLGIPASIIAIGDLAPKPGESFTVAGRQASGSPAAAETATAGRDGAGPQPESNTAGAGGTGGTVAHASISARGGSGTGGPADARAGSSGGGPAGSGGDGDGRPRRTFTIPTNLGPIEVSDWLDGMRRLRFPAKGAFDIVVLGAGLPPEIPPVQAVLKGRPIYTTYIQVGADRDWILQYCPDLPPAQVQKKSSMVVSLAPEPKLESPYVLFAVIPLESPSENGRFLAYYFKISAAGEVSDIRLTGGGVERQASLRQLLESWKFRPAMKGGRGVPLEAVLLVPPGKSLQ